MLVAPAATAQADDKQAQAAALQDQIEASDLEIGALGEQLHAAEARFDAARASALEAQAGIDEAKREVARIKRLIRENAASLYRRNSVGTEDTFDFRDADELLRRGHYAEVQAARDNELLDRLDRAQADLSARRDDAERARDEAAAERDLVNATIAEFEAARGAQQALLDQVKGEIAAEIAAERARREAAVRAKYSAPTGPVSYPNVGPPNGSASQAIAFARGVIGSGYSKNPRMGPTYDCSGLTHMAWRAAGVIIPTVSNTQYAGLPHVPLDAIQPGDLIFYGPGGSAHVALYVGGGMIIDASSSQNAVVERPLWGNPIGAARVV
ncbi:MAG: C40 family peptidase [Acidimicrobiia bacterium]